MPISDEQRPSDGRNDETDAGLDRYEIADDNDCVVNKQQGFDAVERDSKIQLTKYKIGKPERCCRWISRMHKSPYLSLIHI